MNVVTKADPRNKLLAMTLEKGDPLLVIVNGQVARVHVKHRSRVVIDAAEEVSLFRQSVLDRLRATPSTGDA